ncbi:MAG: hypothetical protein V3T84_12730 [Phycisphaerales bacterium]
MSWTNLFRTVFVLLMAGHVFVMYSLARTQQPGFGFDLNTAILSTLFALLMLFPLAPAVALSDLPEVYSRTVRRRRFKNGLCSACCYPVAPSGGNVCQECGRPMTEPEPYRFTWAMARRFAAFALIAWIAGSLASEGWLLADEAAFRKEAEAEALKGHGGLVRDRRWPGNGYLVWDVGKGYYPGQGGSFSILFTPTPAPTDADSK